LEKNNVIAGRQSVRVTSIHGGESFPSRRIGNMFMKEDSILVLYGVMDLSP
jgi:hypothetical protein